MLNVVIVGAGDIGQYVASLLSHNQHNVILVDKDENKLRQASAQMDVAIRQGSGTDWELLDNLLDFSPDFILALTDNIEVNLAVCTIAKNLGYERSVARVKDDRYLNRGRLDFGRIFDVDYFVCPEVLVASDIKRYINSFGAHSMELFAHGAVELKTFVIPESWRKGHLSISELDLPQGMMIALLRRKNPDSKESRVIFPHGHDVILKEDEVTCIGESDVIEAAHHFFGVKEEKIESVVMVGGTGIAYHLAKTLQQSNITTRIIESSRETCVLLAEKLKATTIIHHETINAHALISEKVDAADVFVACSKSDELNLAAALQAKEIGCKKVVAVLSRTDYKNLAEKLELSHIVSPRVSTGNQLLSWVLSDKVTSVVSLYEDQAEVVEIQISPQSKVVGIPINELGPLLPKDFLIAVIQNRGRIMIANGNRILSPGDSVIVVTAPRHLESFQKIF